MGIAEEVSAVHSSPLLLLPPILLGWVLEFVDHRCIHNLEAVCAAASSCIHATGIWKEIAQQSIIMHEDDQPQQPVNGKEAANNETTMTWKRLACLTTMPDQWHQNLLHDVHACSSFDRACESPTNTLQPSRCWLSIQTLLDRPSASSILLRQNDALRILGEVAQIDCCCNSSACYWSSAPSSSSHTNDFIEYTTLTNCLITHIHVLPYRAFKLPDSPSFAPKAVSFAFYMRGHGEIHRPENAPSSSDFSLFKVHETPTYKMKNDMRVHKFALPKKIWLARGGIVRVNLIGRYQRETFEPPPWFQAMNEPEHPPYYCCLSYVQAVGVTDHTNNKTRESEAAKDMPIY